MTQKETLERALEIIGEPDPDDSLDVAIHGVIRTTLDVKEWEAEEQDAIECECDQCVAAVALAHAVIQIAEGEEE